MNFEKLTPKAGITYRLNKNVSLYGNLGGGVEVPAGNETDDLTFNLINPLLKPISSVTYEAGVKSILIENQNEIIDHLALDAAGYYIKITNDIIPYLDGKYYQTVGKSSRKGFEFSGKAHSPSGVGLNTAVTLSSNTNDTYQIDSVIFSASKAGKIGVFDGKKIAGVPAMFFNFGIQYRPVFFGKLSVELNMASTGKYFVDDANILEVPAYSVLNGSIMYEDVISPLRNLGVRIALSANNLTDAKYAASAFINPIKYSGVVGFLEPGLPRNFVFSINFIY
jgi:iron complex outermembrane receptor protein